MLPFASANASIAGLIAKTPPSISVRAPSRTGSKYVGAAELACAASTMLTSSSRRSTSAWRASRS